MSGRWDAGAHSGMLERTMGCWSALWDARAHSGMLERTLGYSSALWDAGGVLCDAGVCPGMLECALR